MSETASPTLAVALRYSDDDAAPVVVASGRGSVAANIVSVAQDHGVSIDENPALATALENVPLDEPIPEALYTAVAEIIGWVLSQRKLSEQAGNWRSDSPANFPKDGQTPVETASSAIP